MPLSRNEQAFPEPAIDQQQLASYKDSLQLASRKSQPNTFDVQEQQVPLDRLSEQQVPTYNQTPQQELTLQRTNVPRPRPLRPESEIPVDQGFANYDQLQPSPDLIYNNEFNNQQVDPNFAPAGLDLPY